MKRRERKWTKGKLLHEPEAHPVMALWSDPDVLDILKKRGEQGLHFNDMRFLLCKDFTQIKFPPKDMDLFPGEKLKRMREYNDYTILQKDLTKLVEIGFLKKEARGFYTHVESPVMRYIQDVNVVGRNLIGSSRNCDIVATESFKLTGNVEDKCSQAFAEIMELRALSFEPRIMEFWARLDASKLDIQQKIILRNEMYPFTQSERLKKLIKKECQISTEKGKAPFDISPFKKRDADRLKRFIDQARKYSDIMGNLVVPYAIGMYSYPDIFTEEYIKKKGSAFSQEMEIYKTRLLAIIMDFTRPCYVLLAPKE